MEVDEIFETDLVETQEWVDALHAVVKHVGIDRGVYLLDKLVQVMRDYGVTQSIGLYSPYCNTISMQSQADYPGDLNLAKSTSDVIRWNAVAMVVRAGNYAPELGGHLATYASTATLYDVGYDFFFKADQQGGLADMVYFQGHASPGNYARAYVEGRFSKSRLESFRQETGGGGLSSYPHPWLMPDFWQFATVSMGLGALQAIYQARFQHYLHARGLIDAKERKIWSFCGDGEMDEPESLGAISLAGRERLDNLIFVISCNLQRLDGPVRGNAKIIQELEGVFRGAGWYVIKVVWGSAWDELFAKDKQGVLLTAFQSCVDGDFQNYTAKGPEYLRKNFFGKNKELMALIADWSDERLAELQRGGHDPVKVYAAYKEAVEHVGQPVIILAKTAKGYELGGDVLSANTAHQHKKLSDDTMQMLAKKWQIPISDKQARAATFYCPDEKSVVGKYVRTQRARLGGYLPSRRRRGDDLKIPELSVFSEQLSGTGEREISTTMAFVRILSILLRDVNIKDRIVPIVPDETRTFGMEGLFRQLGIYSAQGQLYEPVDKGNIMYYRESKSGQFLEEGITEAGAMCSWIAAATSYSNSNLTMIPFYIYYSMFGFQRVGDLAWAAGDMRARGFLLGATSGRTTLAGEGLQHADGNSHAFSSVVPNCVSYDPCFAYELTVIIQHGLWRMYVEQQDVFYYITLLNENYQHLPMPAGVESDIIRGMYCFNKVESSKNRVRLLGSGAILREVLVAADLLKSDYQIDVEVWSVTSFTELSREAQSASRQNYLQPDKPSKTAFVSECLSGDDPVIAATDYVRMVADQIRAYIFADYYVLGTDGFGCSDTRDKLRRHFEINASMIAYMAMFAQYKAGRCEQSVLLDARDRYQIDAEKLEPNKT